MQVILLSWGSGCSSPKRTGPAAACSPLGRGRWRWSGKIHRKAGAKRCRRIGTHPSITMDFSMVQVDATLPAPNYDALTGTRVRCNGARKDSHVAACCMSMATLCALGSTARCGCCARTLKNLTKWPKRFSFHMIPEKPKDRFSILRGRHPFFRMVCFMFVGAIVCSALN